MSVRDKFKPYVDLGIIVIPPNYSNKDCITRANKSFSGSGIKIDKGITDVNFSKSSRILLPGETFRVCIFVQEVDGLVRDHTTLEQRTSSTEERMKYLSIYKNPVFLGAQGAVITLEQKRENMIKGYYYTSFDQEENLWFNGGSFRVPFIFPYLNGDYEIGHLPYDYVWFVHHFFLGFFEVE